MGRTRGGNIVARTSIGGGKISLVAVVVCVIASGLLLIGIGAMIMAQANFPLNFGLIHTVGRTGLWATFVPGLVGLGGLVLVAGRRRFGGALLVLYSLYWVALAVSGLPSVWNAKASFCLRGLNFCITSPWLARGLLFAIAALFILIAFWSFRRAAGVAR